MRTFYFMFLFFIPFGAFSQECAFPDSVSSATYFSGSTLGDCSFPAAEPGEFVVFLSSDLYEVEKCGMCMEVVGDSGNVLARVVGECATCSTNSLDFNPDAYAELNDLSIGVSSVSWQMQECPLFEKILIEFAPGSNQWWASVIIEHHVYPIASVEYWDGAVYQNLPRSSANHFESAGGMGAGPFQFRITDVFGHQVTVNNVPLLNGAVYNTNTQFDLCTNGLAAPLTYINLGLYPNPGSGLFQLDLPNAELGYTAVVYDLSGRLVFQSQMLNVPVLDLQNLAEGMYVLRLDQNGIHYQTRILVAKG